MTTVCLICGETLSSGRCGCPPNPAPHAQLLIVDSRSLPGALSLRSGLLDVDGSGARMVLSRAGFRSGDVVEIRLVSRPRPRDTTAEVYSDDDDKTDPNPLR